MIDKIIKLQNLENVMILVIFYIAMTILNRLPESALGEYLRSTLAIVLFALTLIALTLI